MDWFVLITPNDVTISLKFNLLHEMTCYRCIKRRHLLLNIDRVWPLWHERCPSREWLISFHARPYAGQGSLSNTLRMSAANSFLAKGFMAKPFIPSDFAFSSEIMVL
jgi:hypothetical protein